MADIDLSKVLGSIARVESASADLYGFYADLFDDHTVAAPVFRRLKREEEAHKTQVLFQKRLVDQNSQQFAPINIELDIFSDLVRLIENHISEGVFDVLDAVKFALFLESSAVEAHYRAWVMKQSPELTKLAGFLKCGDTVHIQQLKDLEDVLRQGSSE